MNKIVLESSGVLSTVFCGGLVGAVNSMREVTSIHIPRHQYSQMTMLCL